MLGRVVLASKPVPGSRAEHAARNGNAERPGLARLHQRPDSRLRSGDRDRRNRHEGACRPGRTGGHRLSRCPSPRAGTRPCCAPRNRTGRSQHFVIAPDTKLGIVSDIDDTVMVTALPRPFLALWNTFVLSERARMATPGHGRAAGPAHGGASRRAGHLPVHRAVERSAHPGPVPDPEHVPLRRAAAHGLGTDPGPLVPQRPGTQAPEPGAARGRNSRNMRWLLFGDNGQHDEADLLQFAQEHRGQGGRHRHPAAVRQRGRLRRRPLGRPGTTAPRRCRGSTRPTARASPASSRSSNCSRCPTALGPPCTGVTARGCGRRRTFRRRLRLRTPPVRLRLRSGSDGGPRDAARFRAARTSWSQ